MKTKILKICYFLMCGLVLFNVKPIYNVFANDNIISTIFNHENDTDDDSEDTEEDTYDDEDYNQNDWADAEYDNDSDEDTDDTESDESDEHDETTDEDSDINEEDQNKNEDDYIEDNDDLEENDTEYDSEDDSEDDSIDDTNKDCDTENNNTNLNDMNNVTNKENNTENNSTEDDSISNSNNNEEDNTEDEDYDEDDSDEDMSDDDTEESEDTEEDSDDDIVKFPYNHKGIIDAKQILDKSTNWLKSKNNVLVKTYLTVMNNRFLMSINGYNRKKGITYYESFSNKYWINENDDINYIYDNDSWYITDKIDYSSDDTISINEYIDNMYFYEDNYITEYNGHECYVLELIEEYIEDDEEEKVIPDDQKVYSYVDNDSYTLYIDKETYKLRGILVCSDNTYMELVISYPNSLDIPKNIVKNSLILTNTKLTNKKITYQIYTKNNKNFAKVIGCDKSISKLIIPDTITYKNKTIEVTSINKNAFKDNNKLVKVTLGKNIRTIYKQAFYNCNNIKFVNIKSKNLRKIYKNAFTTNNKIKFKLPINKSKKYNNMINKSY